MAERGGLLVHDNGRVETVGPLSARPRIRLPETRGGRGRRVNAASNTLQTHGWWLASRASGLVALVLVTISVGLGLAMAGKVMRRPGPLAQAAGDPRADGPGRARRDRRPRHHPARRPLAATPASAAIAVPFAMGFRPLFTGLGIIAGYLAALLGLSFYARRRIGARLWRKAHRATVVVYLLGLVHALRRRHRRLGRVVPLVGARRPRR